MKKLLCSSLIALVMGISTSAMAENAELRATLETLNSNWNQALNSGKAAAVAELYTEHAVLSPGNGTTLSGRAAIEKLFQSFVDNGIHNHAIKIIDVGGNERQAYQVARWSANGAEKDGNKPVYGGILMSVIEKDASGKWLSRSHIWNMSN